MFRQQQPQEEQQEQEQHSHNQMMTMTMMMKGKRTKRSRTASPLTLAIPTSAYDTCRVATSSSTTSTHPHPTEEEEEEDMANCLILLAQGATKTQKLNNHVEPQPPITASAAATTVPRAKETAPGMFVYECKTCSRCFPSFQALGGHRASHRNPKLPVTTLSLSEDHRNYFQSAEMGKLKKVEDLGLSLQMACNSSNSLSASNNNQKLNKVHACAICNAEFPSGQALGGHMRRHRPISTSTGGSPATAKSASASASASVSPPKTGLCLDLNLPADEEEEQQLLPESPKFIFSSTEKTLVFANSLVDCRY